MKWNPQEEFEKEIANTPSLKIMADKDYQSTYEKYKKARNPIDRNKIAKLEKIGKGKYKEPNNARHYAGRTRYFNSLDETIAERERNGKLTEQDIKDNQFLYLKYPNGVKYTQKGYPDFTPYCLTDSKNKIIKIKLGFDYTGTAYDYKIAQEKAIKIYPELKGKILNTTAHHNGEDEIVFVEPLIHNTVRHSGGAAQVKHLTQKQLFFRTFFWILKRLFKNWRMWSISALVLFLLLFNLEKHNNKLTASKPIEKLKQDSKKQSTSTLLSGNLTDEIHFLKSSSKLNENDFTALNNIVKLFSTKKVSKILIEGHASSEGDESFNIWLSVQRANSVKIYLTNKGIDDKYIEVKGYGSSVPKTTNETEEGRSMNRRVNIINR